MVDFSVVIDKLHGFEKADDMAGFFRGYGIQAEPGNARTCAITQFIMEETGLPVVSTTLQYVSVYEDEEEMLPSQIVLNTDVMQAFVKNFDAGIYPYLIESGYESDCVQEDWECPCCH